jgi:hypothetical protein
MCKIKNSTEKSTKEMNLIKWIARILSSLTTILWGWWFLGNLIPKYLEEGRAFISDSGELAVSIFFIIVLIGTIIGWWKEKWGGIVLLVGYLANAIGGYILAVLSHGVAGYIIGFLPIVIFLPYLISGILYIDIWKKGEDFSSYQDK